MRNDIKENLQIDNNILEKVEVVGGYLNFYINKSLLTIEVLKQDLHKSISVEDQVVILYALTKGYLDDVNVNDIKSFEQDLIRYMDTNELGKMVKEIIHETHDLPQSTEMDDLLVAFKKER